MRKYIRLIWGILLFMAGCSTTLSYFDEGERRALTDKIADFKELEKSGIKTSAILDTVYTERTVKILGAPIKFYDVKYFFKVNDVQYEGLHTLYEPPQIPFLTIYYLKEKPSVNAVNPKDALKDLKNAQVSKWPLYIGIFLLVFGSISIYSGYREIKRRQREKAEEQQRLLDEYNRSIL